MGYDLTIYIKYKKKKYYLVQFSHLKKIVCISKGLLNWQTKQFLYI